MNTDFKEENLRNLIKQGHHRKPDNIVIEVITLDDDEDEFIDVENFEFEAYPRVVKSEIKEEPDYEVSDKGKLDFEDMGFFGVESGSNIPYSDQDSSGSSTIDDPEFAGPFYPINQDSDKNLSDTLKEEEISFNTDRADDISQEPRKNEIEVEMPDTQTLRKDRDNVKRKQSTRYVARRNFDDQLDGIENKSRSRKQASKSSSQNHEVRLKNPTQGSSVKKHTSPKKQGKKSSVSGKKDYTENPKKRKRIEGGQDQSYPKKKQRRSRSPEELDAKPTLKPNRSVLLINDEMTSIPLDLNQYKARENEEHSKSTKVEQDITSERISNLEDRLNELRTLKLNYQLFQLQQLKNTYNLPPSST